MCVFYCIRNFVLVLSSALQIQFADFARLINFYINYIIIKDGAGSWLIDNKANRALN